MVIEANSGSFTSPSYPGKYTKNVKCAWKITVPKGFRVQLRFDTFDVERYCKYDRVTVLDGPSKDSPWIGYYCGRKKPRILNSDGRSLYVKFVSDGLIELRGFKASFVAIPANGTRNSGIGLLSFYLHSNTAMKRKNSLNQRISH